DALGLGLPKGKQKIKGRLGLTTVDRQQSNGASPAAPLPITPTAPAGAARPAGESAALLSVSSLSVQFLTDAGPATVVDNVSFNVQPGEMLGIVGASGSGKTVTSLAVMHSL